MSLGLVNKKGTMLSTEPIIRQAAQITYNANNMPKVVQYTNTFNLTK